MKKTGILISLIILSVVTCFGQKKFTKEQLKNDADTLYSVITEIHPNPFYKFPKTDFDREFNTLKTNLKDSLTDWDFYRLIAPLIAKLNDGHTSILFPESKIAGQKYFPFRIKITDNHNIHIIESYGNFTLPKNTQITHISGKKSEDIVNGMLNYAFGETQYFKRNYIGFMFSDYLSNLYQDSIFIINYIDEHGKSHSIKVDGVDSDVIIKARQHLFPEKELELSLDCENKIAVLGFNSCMMEVKAAQDFFKKSFDSINKMGIEYLIIDARFNGGGTDLVGNEFLKYISDVPFRQYDGTDIKISHRLVNGGDFYEKSPEVVEKLKKDGPYVILADRNSRGLLNPYPDSVRFHGQKYLLTGFFNFSAGTDFSWAFWKFGLGKVIGEETGGLGHSYGSSFSYKLPNTQLKYNVSHRLFYNYQADENSVHGVQPDIEVPYEQALDYTINLIKSK